MMTSIKPMVYIEGMEAPVIRKPHAVEQLSKAIDSKGLNIAGSASEMKLAQATIYRWMSEEAIPDQKSIQKIYRFLELIGYETEPAPADEVEFLENERREKRRKKVIKEAEANNPKPVVEELAELKAALKTVQNENTDLIQELDVWKKRITMLENNWLETMHIISSRFPELREQFNELVKRNQEK